MVTIQISELEREVGFAHQFAGKTLLEDRFLRPGRTEFPRARHKYHPGLCFAL